MNRPLVLGLRTRTLLGIVPVLPNNVKVGPSF